ncbi:MAG: hypothetical protein ACXAC8_02785 [Candidatus Hodarchaeales archaeon]|jgi:hypothetical protein
MNSATVLASGKYGLFTGIYHKSSVSSVCAATGTGKLATNIPKANAKAIMLIFFFRFIISFLLNFWKNLIDRIFSAYFPKTSLNGLPTIFKAFLHTKIFHKKSNDERRKVISSKNNLIGCLFKNSMTFYSLSVVKRTTKNAKIIIFVLLNGFYV